MSETVLAAGERMLAEHIDMIQSIDPTTAAIEAQFQEFPSSQIDDALAASRRAARVCRSISFAERAPLTRSAAD